MKRILISTAFTAALAVSAYGQGITVGNTGNNNVGVPLSASAATSGGLVWTNDQGNVGLFDGFDFNVGITVFGGSSSTSLSPIATILPLGGGFTGFNYGQFLPTGGSPALVADYNVPGVAPGGTAWIDLQMWAYEVAAGGGATGPYSTFDAAKAGGALWGEVLFQNPTSNPPLTPNQNFTGMPALVLSPVPEPTTLALGALGLASLLVIRRRK